MYWYEIEIEMETEIEPTNTELFNKEFWDSIPDSDILEVAVCNILPFSEEEKAYLRKLAEE